MAANACQKTCTESANATSASVDFTTQLNLLIEQATKLDTITKKCLLHENQLKVALAAKVDAQENYEKIQQQMNIAEKIMRGTADKYAKCETDYNECNYDYSNVQCALDIVMRHPKFAALLCEHNVDAILIKTLTEASFKHDAHYAGVLYQQIIKHIENIQRLVRVQPTPTADKLNEAQTLAVYHGIMKMSGDGFVAVSHSGDTFVYYEKGVVYVHTCLDNVPSDYLYMRCDPPASFSWVTSTMQWYAVGVGAVQSMLKLCALISGRCDHIICTMPSLKHHTKNLVVYQINDSTYAWARGVVHVPKHNSLIRVTATLGTFDYKSTCENIEMLIERDIALGR